MRRSLLSIVVAGAAGALAGCGAAPSRQPARSVRNSPQAPVAGTLALDGLHAPVDVVRDRWGVPHIDAQNEHDLFFAQGFVQAEDRLFQMDLWRRSVQGRLSEVLGANFVERDAMTRRIQYSGAAADDWAASPPGAQAIAQAFVEGVNAWVARTQVDPPEAFVLAGWRPEPWHADDLLNRTDAFLASGDAVDEVLRARIVASVGERRAAALLSGLIVPRGLDVSGVTSVVADALHRVGTAPFFVGLAASPRSAQVRSEPHGLVASNVWAIAGARTGTGAPVLASDPHRAFTSPSAWYLVHLHAPGWDVTGASVPWLPGVVMGHNTRIAWGFAGRRADVQDLFVERVNPSDAHQVATPSGWAPIAAMHAPLAVRGRAEPIDFIREMTPHGVIVATDHKQHLVYALRWIGFEPGSTALLGALALDRAQTWNEFRRALRWWKAPAATFVYADRDGVIASQAAGLEPDRRGWDGRLPAPGWTGTNGWRGWRTLDRLPHAVNPREGLVVSANGSAPRTNRIAEVIGTAGMFGARASAGLQHDVHAWMADQLLPRLENLHGDRPDVETARMRLMRWNRDLTTDSADAALYVLWEQRLEALWAQQDLDPRLAGEYISSGLAPPLALATGLDPLMIPALADAVAAAKQLKGRTWGAVHSLTFEHPLAITDATRHLFGVGPFQVPGYAGTVMATTGPGLSVAGGPSFRQVLDLSDWDRARVTSAPGQSESPASPHFADLAKIWAAGEEFPLPFSDTAVSRDAGATLRLVPRTR
jgi:penicillin amidase